MLLDPPLDAVALQLGQGDLPFPVPDSRRLLAGKVPDEVLMTGKHLQVRVLLLIGSGVDRRAVGQEDVPGDGEARLDLRPGNADGRTSAQGENVVPDGVVAAVMLIVGVGGGVVAEVLFDQDLAAALIGIDTPAAVVAALHVVDPVVPDDGAGLPP